MLKKRIIPIQLLLNNRLVKTVRFGQWRDVGDPVKSSAVYNSQYADELILLNIARSQRSVFELRNVIAELSKVCFMPVSMGGGIKSYDDAAFLILNGADKIVLNSAAFPKPGIISTIAKSFGSQAVIVGIDAAWDVALNRYVLYSECGRCSHYTTLENHVRRCTDAGAGEIMIQSIDRDGTMTGFDIPLIERTMSVTKLPIIAAGGSGNYEHLKDAFLKTDVSALACGSLFNFSDSNPMRAKAFLSNYGLAFKVV